MLKPDFKMTGIAICPHKAYGYHIVVTYAGEFRPSEYGKRELERRAKN